MCILRDLDPDTAFSLKPCIWKGVLKNVVPAYFIWCDAIVERHVKSYQHNVKKVPVRHIGHDEMQLVCLNQELVVYRYCPHDVFFSILVGEIVFLESLCWNNPMGKRRNNNVIITSKRRRFDVILTLLLRRASVGIDHSRKMGGQESVYPFESTQFLKTAVFLDIGYL